jgi:hypothetical protein
MRPSVLTSRQYHQDRFFRVSTSTDAYKFSFIPRTITDWNWLPQGIIQAPSTDVFRAGVCGSTNPFWAENDELYLASSVGDHDSIYIFMQQNMSTFEYSGAGWHDIEVQA